MKLLRFEYQGARHVGVLTGAGIAPVSEVNARRGSALPDDLLAIIQGGDLEPLRDLRGVELLPVTEARPVLPYDVPPKIWCIGLNYKSHAEDIQAVQPEEPGSFMKPASCMFEPGGDIILPPPEVSDEVDAEGELGVIIGRKCRFLDTAETAGGPSSATPPRSTSPPSTCSAATPAISPAPRASIRSSASGR